ncbi:MAG TPA: hypothetical protein VFG46_16360 [Chryseolinea sp.]|nr:hypothetical protein [Chryseolinea sp.]
MNNKMRIFHRYLGFFLSGIMAVYAISGIVMIFRETEFLKSERELERQLAVGLPDAEVGSTLRIKEFKVERSEGSMIYFREGTYDKKTGLAKFKAKQLPYVLDKMTKLHKATTNRPLFFLNIFFGVALLFFVLSAFWMFMPKTDVFRKGLYFALGGIVLTLILVFL